MHFFFVVVLFHIFALHTNCQSNARQNKQTCEFPLDVCVRSSVDAIVGSIGLVRWTPNVRIATTQHQQYLCIFSFAFMIFHFFFFFHSLQGGSDIIQ